MVGKVVKFRKGNDNILISTELPTAKLRAIRDYCSGIRDVPVNKNLLNLSKNLASIIERNKMISPHSFAESVEESLRETFGDEYEKDGKTLCNVSRVYILEIILPSVLDKEKADAIGKCYH